MNGDCAGSYGSGSSCTSSHTCRCRQPTTPGNLLTNPGFETSLTGWKSADNCSSCPQLEFWDGQNDADSCTASGSVHLTYYGFAFGGVSQCLNVGANSYHFGYRFKQLALGNDDAVRCGVDAYPGTGCDVTTSPLASLNYNSGPSSTSWASPSMSTLFVAPAGTNSILITCQQNNLTDVWVDQVYLNVSGFY